MTSLIKTLPIALIVFGAIILFGFQVNNEVGSRYGVEMVPVNDSFSDTAQAVNNISLEMEGDVFGNISTTEDNAFNSLVKGSYKAVKVFPQFLTLAGSVIKDVASFFKIPNYIIVLAISALIITFVITIVLLVLGRLST